MKKIKRTITVRKIEIIGNQQQNNEPKVEVCPLCHSPIHVLTPAIDESATESLFQFPEKREIVIEGDKNE